MHNPVTFLRKCAQATDGNIAVLFAIAAVPIITAIGAAVDYTRANSARSSMQAALDSASLMVSRDFNNGTITSSQISTKATDYFNALYHSKDAKSVAVTATYTAPSGSTPASVKLTGTGSITTNFMKVAGFPTLPLNTSSTTSWGINKLRVALALDNTGSMLSGDKIGSLKTASKNLVTQLSALARNNGDVYISVIPFALDVNVGTANVNASWIRWDSWDPNNYWNASMPWATHCDNGNWLTMAHCIGRGYNWNHTVGSPSRSLWNGCVTDRDQNYDTTSTAPTSYSTYFVADQDQYCPIALLPLTYNWTTINNTIDSMTAQGATNQTIGLQWAWLSLLQQNPLNAPSEPNDGSIYQRIVVLFTDGLNTGDRWYGNLSSQSTSVDNRMKALCDNVKASGITLYTVQIDTEGAGQSAVLPYCASGTQNFFMLTDPSQINAAFSQIGTSISKLRVAK